MIKLEPITHTYHNSDKPNVKYTSVTTVLGMYKNHFDEDYHATRIAERRGTTKELVIQEWRELNRMANEYGTNVHEIIERLLLAKNGLYSPRDEFEVTIINAFKRMCMEESLTLLDNYYTKPEYIMSIEFNDTCGVAGTSDIIEDIPNNRFNVWDVKTNKKFEFENKYNEYLLFPLEHLTHCQYNDYALQISVYGVMYERETGKKFNRGGLFYWDKLTNLFKLIPVPYMKKEAELLINHYELSVLNKS